MWEVGEEGEVRVGEDCRLRKFESRNLDKMASKKCPSTLKTDFFPKKTSRVGYVCIEESFNTIFNIGCGEGGGGVQRPPPHGLWVETIGHGREGKQQS